MDNHNLCPACGGGSKQERSWSTWSTDDGVGMGKCHRASCGHVEAGGRVIVGKKAPRPAAVTLETRAMTDRERNAMTVPERCHWEEATDWVVDANEPDTTVFTLWQDWWAEVPKEVGVATKRQRLLGWDGYGIKGVTRLSAAVGSEGRGLLTCTANGLPPLRSEVNRPDVVLVEDCMSALAVTATGVAYGVPLLGTGTTKQMRSDMLKLSMLDKRVIIALDADATDVALTLLEQLPLGSAKVRLLDKDIKDIPLRDRVTLVSSFFYKKYL